MQSPEALDASASATISRIAQDRDVAGVLALARRYLELAALTTQLPHAEQLPSIELMTEIKQVLEERRDQKESRKQTRFLLKRGMFWLPFAILAAVLGEPAKRWVGLKTGWW